MVHAKYLRANNGHSSKGAPYALFVAIYQGGQRLFGWSLCSRKDRFTRAQAWDKAVSRLAPLENVEKDFRESSSVTKKIKGSFLDFVYESTTQFDKNTVGYTPWDANSLNGLPPRLTKDVLSRFAEQKDIVMKDMGVPI